MVRATFGGGFQRPRTPDPLAQDPADQRENPDKDRLDDLGRKIEAARGSTSDSVQKTPSGGLNIAYRLSTEFVASVFVGAALGWGFDFVTGLRPVGIILFSILGVVAAFYSVFRAARELAAEQSKEGK
jgi:ATP synthase protein I